MLLMIKVFRFGRSSYARAPWPSDNSHSITASAAEWFSSNFQVFFSCHDGFLVGECAKIRNRDSVLPDKVGCYGVKVV